MGKGTADGRANRRAGRKARAVFPAGLEQVRALSHPLRLRLLELFAERPRTAKQAAEALGEAPTRLYHHVAALERAGLVRLRETRQIRGATEKYFEAVTRGLDARSAPAAAAEDAAPGDYAALGMVLFDEARNEFVQAIGRCGPSGARDIVALRTLVNLSPRQLAGLRRRLVEVVKDIPRAARGREGAGGRSTRRRYALTIALVPVDASGG